MHKRQMPPLYSPQMEHDNCGVGLIASLNKEPSHDILDKAITALINLTHRGAVGGDANTGDGAGILFEIPHEFFQSQVSALKSFNAGSYGVAQIFFPMEKSLRDKCISLVEKAVKSEGLDIIEWRDVPVDDSDIGYLAKQSQPFTKQLFIKSGKNEVTESKLFVVRRVIENSIAAELKDDAEAFYICSLSTKKIVYKGMLLAEQVPMYFQDFKDSKMKSRFAILHQRYSTNTMPEWKLAHPFRYVAHNGEINTLRGNVNKMVAREENLESEVFGDDIKKLFPVVTPGGSDSASFDNALELLIQAGRSPEEAMIMMVPEAFGKKIFMSEDRRAYYEYYSSIMEPWDGPAAIIATDGKSICATLDRNGLRPARYVISNDGYIVLGSEIGVVEFADDNVKHMGRLQPGRMLSIDIENGRIKYDNEIKSKIVRKKPYRRWLEKNRIELKGLYSSNKPEVLDENELLIAQNVFGYTKEEIKMQIQDMAENGQEPIGAMGMDAPLAILSKNSQLFFNYFKQLFAQVTNPAIDPYRESLVMSLMTWLGKKSNVLSESESHCRQLKLPHPVMKQSDIDILVNSNHPDLQTAYIDITIAKNSTGKDLDKKLDDICEEALKNINSGKTILILTDKNFSKDIVPIPSLLALAAVHQHLVRVKRRESVGLIVHSGEVRETMHFATLIGYGANAVCPYLAFQTLTSLHTSKDLPEDITLEDAYDNYINGIKKGLLKTLSRMGISTLRSYQGAQIFEAIGVAGSVIDKHFTGTATRIEGADYDIILQESKLRHDNAYPGEGLKIKKLSYGGMFNYRKDGELHLWNPQTIALIQDATSHDDYGKYKEFAKLVNYQQRDLYTLRGMLKFKDNTNSIPIEEVEPAENIYKRFATGAMSYGSISIEAHEALAIAMNRIGGSSNTGEGGEDVRRFTPYDNGDNACSAIKQIASGRFGVTAHYLANAKEIQIKIAQGAKPGEGGQLPGHKVNEIIGKTRHSTPGVTLISPPPHHDIYSIEDIAQLIFDLHCSNLDARVSVKLVSEVGVSTVAAGVAKGKADMVLIAGYDGGTGASPLTSIQHAGLPWELGLAETQQVLVANHLRDKVRVQVDGKLMTGRDVVIGALLGAEEYGFATAALIVLGCTMLRKCHLNTCTMGVATQDTDMRALFRGKADYVVNYFKFITQEIREYMAQLGVRTIDELIGRSDLLEVNKNTSHWKSGKIDFSKILYKEENPPVDVYCTKKQDHLKDTSLDKIELIEKVKDSIETGKSIKVETRIKNIHRSVGTILSGLIAKKHGGEGLPDDTIHIKFKGYAGQSFGAFLTRGVKLEMEGYVNDYLGKGMSGGKIIVYPPESSKIDHGDNIIVGNTLLYGATGGKVFISGAAGERFAVRNSGVEAVVEGVGDHGCEYMTGGKVVILGTVGKNFAAGMSGGIAYVWDPNQTFDTNCNLEMVDLMPVIEQSDIAELYELITEHYSVTKSAMAGNILSSWNSAIDSFVKVYPVDYKAAMERMKAEELADSDSMNVTEEVYNG